MSSGVEARVGVVTVTYRSTGDIEDFLASASGRTGVREPIVVVDNLSEDSPAIAELVRRARAEIISLDANVGYGHAANIGVAALGPDIEFVLIANPDVRLHDGTVERLIDALDVHPEAAIVGPRILGDDGEVYPSARELPSLRTGIGHALFSRAWPGNPWTRSYRQEFSSPQSGRNVGWLSGSCFLVRRHVYEELGGFDEDYFMYFEDVDLGYRVGNAGWTNRYVPTAEVTHIGGTSTATARTDMILAHHRSAERFLSKKYHGWYFAPLRLVLRVALMVRARWVTRG